ncbi:activating signal cointegrator 1 [Sarotherodon galilaeus]
MSSNTEQQHENNMSRPHDILRQQMMHRLLSKLEAALNQQPLNLDYLEFLTRHELVLFESFSQQIGGLSEITEALQNVHHLVQCEINITSVGIIELETEVGLGPGHPKIVLEREKLKNLLDTQLPVSCIAKCLGVSRRTIFRRMQEFDLSVRGTYSTMNDQELDNIISTIKNQMPNAGYRMVQGHLVSMGLRVQWWRMMASMHRVDAVGIFTRITELGCVVRRSYSVRGPLSLVHIDTNHKLIRYNVVIFGGVDGYSRKVLYLDAATNNRAKTAFSFFLRSAQLHGLPSRVRADQGVENLDIAHFMFATRGTGRASFISGKNVHNQSTMMFFTHLRRMACLTFQMSFISLVSTTSLSLDSEQILSPLLEDGIIIPSGQKVVSLLNSSGVWDIYKSWTTARDLRYQIIELQDPGIDWESAVLQEESNSTVVVPEIECPLDEETLEGLQRTINPLEHSESYGRDLYIQFLLLVSNQQ